MLNYKSQIEQESKKTLIRKIPEKYSGGWFDGLIGETPMYPENTDYWSGYSLGYREFWCRQKSVELSDRF